MVNKHEETTSEKDAKASNNNVMMWARSAIFFYLLVACVVCGWGAHYMFSLYENKVVFAGYKAIVDDLASAAGEAMRRNKLSTQLLATAAGVECPDASIWPNCSMPMAYYYNFNAVIKNSSSMRSLVMSPILRKHEVAPFEEFAYNFFESEGYGPPINLGVSSIGKGIYASNASNGGALYHTVEEYEGGSNPFFIPVFQNGATGLAPNAVMYNIYTEPLRVQAVDDMITCVNSGENPKNCGMVTDFINLIVDSELTPGALTLHPIYPRNDNTTVVGVAMSVWYWAQLLEGHLPETIGTIVVVVHSDLSTFTFKVKGGSTTLLGEGDLHDSDFDGYKHDYEFKNFPHSSVSYSLSIYPTAAYASQSTTTSPIYASITAIAVIILTSIVVFLYDSSVAREVHEKEVVMETKRLFVRYISHEIRTPLNTVHLGLVVLLGEMERVIKDVMSLSTMETTVDFRATSATPSSKVKVTPDSSNPEDDSMLDLSVSGMTSRQRIKALSKEKIAADMSSWIDLINEIEESSDVAVTVLNDLINYDKIVGGLLKMDLSEVFLWPLILSTIRPFNLQAKEKNIKFKLYNNCSEEDAQKLIVIADSVKLSQVVRNLLSNALKFTPRGGRVSISVEWIRQDALNSDINKLAEHSSSDTTINVADYKLQGNILVSVKDSGVGMSQDNLLQLFNEGVQFNPNQLQGGQGSGLGLWVSKGFVVRHGGTLTATSEGIGKGAVFLMQLPVFLAIDTSGPRTPFVTSDVNVSTRLTPPPDVEQGFNLQVSNEASQNPSAAPSCGNSTTDQTAPKNGTVENGGSTMESPPSNITAVHDVSHLVDGSGLIESREDGSVKQRTVDPTSATSKDAGGAEKAPLLPSNGAALPLIQKTGSNSRKEVQSSLVKQKSYQLDPISNSGDAHRIKSILVVDDAASNRKILCRLLKNGGYRVGEAEDGSICVDMVKKSMSSNLNPSVYFDMILLDFQMPVLNGPNTAKKLRELRYKGPIVGLTGNVLQTDLEVFINHGANAVMSKPIQFNELNKLIDTFEREGWDGPKQ